MERIGMARWSLVVLAGTMCLALAVATAAAGDGEPWSAWSSVPEGQTVNLGDPDLAPDAYGATVNMDYISAEEFTIAYTNIGSSWPYRKTTAGYWTSSTGVELEAAVEVPAGALITGMRILYFDDSADYELYVALLRADTTLTDRTETLMQSWSSDGYPGLAQAFVDVSPDHTVVRRYPVLTDWGYRSYYIYAILQPTTSLQLRGVCVFWTRQISLPPHTATFNDVPVSHSFFRHIEALAASGITSGCGGGNYCPDAPLTRGQMAVFLAKGLGLHWPY